MPENSWQEGPECNIMHVCYEGDLSWPRFEMKISAIVGLNNLASARMRICETHSKEQRWG